MQGISKFQQSTLHQGRIEQYFLDFIDRNSNIAVERGRTATHIHWNEGALQFDPDAFPVEVRIEDSLQYSPCAGDGNASFTLKCKYVVACDGAHSKVRNQLGLVMEGQQTESVWGVMDIIPITDFRQQCATIWSWEPPADASCS